MSECQLFWYLGAFVLLMMSSNGIVQDQMLTLHNHRSKSSVICHKSSACSAFSFCCKYCFARNKAKFSRGSHVQELDFCVSCQLAL